MKPILFIDFDGTLCHDKFWRSVDADNFGKIQKFLFGQNKSIVRDWMSGIYSSEDINQLIAKELNITYENLWNVFVKDCKNMSISRDTLNRIENFRKNYATILITDNMDCFTRFTVPAQKLDLFFDLIVNSFENKKFKNHNDGENFSFLANGRGAKIDDCVLIDNSKTACNFFSKLGGKSYFVTPERTLDYWLKNLENELVRT